MPTAEEVAVAEETGQGEGEAERVVQATAPQATRKYKPRDSTSVYDPIYNRLIDELVEQLYGEERYVHWWCYFVVTIVERQNNPEYATTRKLASYDSNFRGPGNSSWWCASCIVWANTIQLSRLF